MSIANAANVGNLTLNANSTGAMTITNATNTGSVTNSGSGTGTSTFTNIGTNVTSVNENSNTSPVAISGTITVNSVATTLATSSVETTFRLLCSGPVNGTGNLILQNNGTGAGDGYG